MPPPLTHKEYYTLYFDGSVMATSVGARVILISPIGNCMEYAI